MIKRLIGMLFISLACTSLVNAEAVKKEKIPEKKQEKAKPIAAKKLFGFVLKGADLKAKAIGYYTRGCLSGGQPLAVNGEAWQAMRLSRNRNWGHPVLIKFIEEFAKTVKEEDGWKGILVGDLSQPRGGPMLSGHRSHQMGLDADIWLNEMPDKRLTYKEREEISAVSMLDKTGLAVNPNVWTENHVKVIKRATQFKAVQRVLVHPAIKKALCKAAGDDRGWLRKVRPWWGHHYHMHIRLKCTEPSCKAQGGTPAGDGCGKPLDYWFKLLTRPVKPKKKPKGPPKKPRVKDLNWMPKACHVVLKAGDPPLLKARQLKDEIELPVRKAVAKAQETDDKLGELIESTETDPNAKP